MGIFKRLLFGKPPLRITVPVLGECLLMETKRGSYWEVETEVSTKPFTLMIETTGSAAPTTLQVAFFKQFCEAPTMAFHRAKGLLVPGYEDWTRQQFPQRWEDAFDFVGMTVPLDGNERNPWDLSFECLRDRGRHHFCCTFEQGNPKSLQIDG
ncbi:hypothetical protein [Ottowia sp.]|uniref:hypothetical protein n=1 Tax=Ottowia sp. TaxID=1898956 RepID=UPI0025D6407F|nr:hypothetical protein [Ottowia sp.]MBK6616682.1 hypothetical protein [Ottowia sp.]